MADIRKLCWLCCVCCAVAVGLCDGGMIGGRDAHAAGRVLRTWQLKEQLNKTWSREFVSFAYRGYRSARCRAGQRLVLVGPAGRALPHQLHKGRIYFVVQRLPALATHYYRLHCRAGKMPATDFLVKASRKGLAMMTSRFAANFPMGAGRNPRGFVARRVPGPIRNMVVRRRGRVIRSFGRSEMFGRDVIIAYSSKLEVNGPVFARIAFVYHYKGRSRRGRYEYKLHLKAELVTGGAQLRWTSRIERIAGRARQARRSGWRLVLSRRSLPSLVLVRRAATRATAVLSRSSSVYARAIARDSPRAFVAGRHRYRVFYLNVWRWPAGLLVGRISPWNFYWNQESFARLDLLHGRAGRRLPLFQVTSLEVARWTKSAHPPTLQRIPPSQSILKLCPTLRRTKGAQPALSLAFPNVVRERVWRWGNPSGALGRELNRAKGYVMDWSEVSPRTPMMLDSAVLARYRRLTKPKSAAFRRKVASAGRLVTKWIRNMKWRQKNPHKSVPISRLGNRLLGGAIRLVVAVNLADQSLSTLRGSRLKEMVGFLLVLARDAKQHASGPEVFDPVDHFFFRYHGHVVIQLYDLLRSNHLWRSTKERKLFRAQAAYFAYRMCRPEIWSPSRGYAMANLNMTMDVVFTRGLLSALFPRHPQARKWQRYGRLWEDFFLNNRLGPKGETDQNDNYSLSLINAYLMFSLAVPAPGRGLRHPKFKLLIQYILGHYSPADPRFSRTRRIISYSRSEAGKYLGLPGVLAKAYDRLGERKLSRMYQYFWKSEGGEARLSKLGVVTYRLLCVKLMVDEQLHANKGPWMGRQRSVANRNYTSFRHSATGRRSSASEHQMFFLHSHLLSVGSIASGTIKSMFAYGQPLVAPFGHGVSNANVPRLSQMREAPLQSRLLISRPWLQRKIYAGGRYGRRFLTNDFSEIKPKRRRYSGTSRFDYLAFQTSLGFAKTRNLFPIFAIRKGIFPGARAGKFKGRHKPYVPIWPTAAAHRKRNSDSRAYRSVLWQRQIAFLKEPNAAGGVHYYVFRDDATSLKRGKQIPTEWTMWSLTDGLYPTKARSKPRKRSIAELRPRRLSGQRFTALGRRFQGKGGRLQPASEAVDLEYFVVHPSRTPKHTLHWGMRFTRNFGEGYNDFQDLLHLQRRNDGAYFVVAFPRRNVARRPAAPRFQALGPRGQQKVIRIHGRSLAGGAFTDIVFMTDKTETHTLPNAPLPQRGTFAAKGKMASVQYRNGRVVALNLGAIGSPGQLGFVQVPGYRLAAKVPCSLVIEPGARRLRVEISTHLSRTQRVRLQVPFRLRGLSGQRRGGSYTYSLNIRRRRSYSFR